MIRGAIFDMDGTLLDSMSVWDYVAENYLLSEGFTPGKDVEDRFKTMSLSQAALYLRDVYHVPHTEEEIIEGINRIVERQYLYEVGPKAGIPELLESFSKNGVRMCVATATDKNQASAALKRTGLLEYFDFIITCEEAGHAKDEPVIYRKALEKLGTEKDKTYVFEDALHAARTAHEDGFHLVSIYDSHEPEQERLKSISDVYIQDIGSFVSGSGLKKLLS